jgi:TPR repeat protein
VLISIGAFYAWKKSPMGFAILYFYITIIPAMGFVFLRGGIFAERLLYAPSLAFCIVVPLLLDRVMRAKITDGISFRSARTKSTLLLIFCCSVLFTGYSWKTIARNRDWKDNLTLVSADHNLGSNSAQNHYQYGMLMVDKASAEQNNSVRDSLLTEGIRVLKQAVNLVPAFPDAYFRLGYAYELRMMNNPSAANTDTALYFFTRAVETGPSLGAAFIHLGHIYHWLRNYDKAIFYYTEAQKRDPASEEIKSKLMEISEEMNKQGIK